MKEIVQEVINVLLNSRGAALKVFCFTCPACCIPLFCVSMINGLRVTGRPTIFEIASKNSRRMLGTRFWIPDADR